MKPTKLEQEKLEKLNNEYNKPGRFEVFESDEFDGKVDLWDNEKNLAVEFDNFELAYETAEAELKDDLVEMVEYQMEQQKGL